LQSRGTFLREEILSALTASQGNVDAAYLELSKAQLKPFLMRIWGPPSGLDNDAVPPSPIVKNFEAERVEVSLDSKDEISPQANKPNKSTGQPQSTSYDESVSSGNGSNSSSNAPLSSSIISGTDLLGLGELEPDPKLEILVSSAAKVTQEIERAIQELKMSKSKQQSEQGTDEKDNLKELKKEVGESTNLSGEDDASNLSRSRLEEGVASPASLTVKSDEGEGTATKVFSL